MLPFKRSRFIRQGFLSLLSFVCVLTFASCSANGPTLSGSPRPEITLTIAVSPSFPPFQYTDSSGPIGARTGDELKGFEIDLIRAVAEAAQFGVHYESMPFNQIIPSLQGGKADATISALTITPDRAQVVDFTRPYFQAGLAIAVQDNNTDITSFETLRGKRVGVQLGTTGEAKANTSGGQVVTFVNASLALQALADGDVDAVINDAPATSYAIQKGTVQGIKVLSPLITEEYYGIATPKGSPNLERLNAGLNSIMESGRYAEIYREWFASDPPMLPDSAPL